VPIPTGAPGNGSASVEMPTGELARSMEQGNERWEHPWEREARQTHRWAGRRSPGHAGGGQGAAWFMIAVVAAGGAVAVLAGMLLQTPGVFAAGGLAVWLAVTLAMLALPDTIATWKEHHHRNGILVLSVVGIFIWPCWLAALIWALALPQKRRAAADGERGT